MDTMLQTAAQVSDKLPKLYSTRSVLKKMKIVGLMKTTICRSFLTRS